MEIFVTPYVLTENTSAFGSYLNANFVSIQTELNNVKNIARNSISTDQIDDGAVGGDNIYIDNVIDDYDIISLEFITNRIVTVDSDPPYAYDINYVIGQIVGEDDLIWDSGDWASDGTSTPTWADAPEFTMIPETPSADQEQWRSSVYAVRHPGLMRFSIKLQDFNSLAAVMIGYPSGSLLPDGSIDEDKINDYLTSLYSNGLSEFSTYFLEDVSEYSGTLWSDYKSGTDYIQFSPAFIHQSTDLAGGASLAGDIDITIPVQCSQAEPAFVCLIMYKATYYSASTRLIALDTDEATVSQVRYMAIGEPSDSEVLIEKVGQYYDSSHAFSEDDFCWYSGYIYKAAQDTTGNAPTGSATSNSYWTYKATIGA